MTAPGNIPVLAVTPGMTPEQIQAAVNTYNAQVPTYSGGTNIEWAVSANPQYNIYGQAVVEGSDPRLVAAEVAKEQRAQTMAMVAAAEAGETGTATTTAPSGTFLFAIPMVILVGVAVAYFYLKKGKK